VLQRVLWVSLTQALRSVALVLLPSAFISLLAWATAGSTAGNTIDPMRVAGWMWLASHHIPFALSLPPMGEAGALSYLPLGALLFPFLAIRSGFIRAVYNLDESERDVRGLRLTRSAISIFYTGFVALIAWVTATSSVRPSLYLVPVATLPISWLAMSTVRNFENRKRIFSIEIALRFIAVITGLSALVLSASLFMNQATIKNLTLVLQPGWLGGALLFFISLLYIPNAIIATLSYLIGPGFAVGVGTSLSALTHRVSEIPALPLLGTLPSGRHPMILFSAFAITLGGIVIYTLTIRRGFSTFAVSSVVAIAGFALLAFLSSGELLTQSMATVGVSTWRFTLAIFAEFGLGALLAWFGPWLFGRMRSGARGVEA
jgi:hypothetical protein